MKKTALLLTISMYILWMFCMIYNVPFDPYGYIWVVITTITMTTFAVTDYPEPKKMDIPEEGRQIKITWFPHCKNVPSHVTNPYISMEGTVREVNPDGSFKLECKTAWLIVSNISYKFEYTDGKE